MGFKGDSSYLSTLVEPTKEHGHWPPSLKKKGKGGRVGLSKI